MVTWSVRFPAEVAERQVHEKPHSGSRVEAAPSVAGRDKQPTEQGGHTAR